jgi:uncharacterized protein involved in exopolysaccharide biosynthesis
MADDDKKNKVLIFESELNLKDAIEIFWKSKLTIISITSAFAIFSIFYALSIPNQYSASVLLKLTEDSSSSKASSFSSQVGGLASLAGISLPSGGGDKTYYAIETIQSKDFLKHLLTFPMIKQNLIAAENYQGGKIVYKEDLYDEKNNIWTREPSNGRQAEPSHIEVHKELMKKLSIDKDKDSAFIKIQFEHFSPIFAYEFINLIVREINNVSRIKDLNESTLAIKYFNETSSKTQTKNIKSSLNSLIEGHLKTQMLANVRQDYLLTPIDSAFVPELKSAPKRSIICILITFFGGLLSLVVVLINHIRNNKE